MKFPTALLAIPLLVAAVSNSTAAVQHSNGYMLVDTTSLPPPATGMARLVVARDMKVDHEMKPEFVFVDTMPVGFLPQRSVVTFEVAPGWHRVWLGRGTNIRVWMEFAPDRDYLLRLREGTATGAWRGDLVREWAQGYGPFALSRKMKLAVMDDAGRGALERDLAKSNVTAAEDSAARLRAVGLAALPIVIEPVWYLQLPSDAHSGEYQNNPGKLTVDEQSLRFTRGHSTVIEIPRATIHEVHFANQRGGTLNAWIKVGYGRVGIDSVAGFADAHLETATENYNRLFAELAKPAGPH